MGPVTVVRKKRGYGTYDDLAEWVNTHYNFKPHASWIAHCKEMAGLPVNCPYLGHRPEPSSVLPKNGKSYSKLLKAFKLILGALGRSSALTRSERPNRVR